MRKSAYQLTSATAADIRVAVTESLEAGSLSQFNRVSSRADLVELERAIYRRLAEPTKFNSRDQGATTVPVPLNLGGAGVIAYAVIGGPALSCTAVVPVGRGHFVFGSSNMIFGKWNALVAAGTSVRCEILPGHGGEIIPGTLDEHIARIRDNLASGTRVPVQVDMDVSMACPSECVFCFSSDYRASRSSGRLMAPQLILRLIRQWADIGVRVIRFDGGGDPLTHPALMKAITLCAELKLRTAVLTAGDLLSEAQFDTFLLGRTYVRVSLNAATDQTRRILHGQRKAGYGIDQILDAVAALSSARNSRLSPAHRTEMLIGATSMIHPINIYETREIALRAKAAGFDHLSFRVILGRDRRVNFSDSERAELADAFDDIRRDIAEPNFQVFMPTREITDQGYIPSQYFDICRASTHRALVEVGPAPDQAAVVPCGRYRGHGYKANCGERVVFGYLDNQRSPADVWMQPSMVQLLSSFPDRCGDCIDRSANIFLQDVEAIIQEDPGVAFFPFLAVDQPTGNRHA